MKNLKRIDEAVGSLEERRVAADRLLKDVVKGSTSAVEGIKLSKEMAQAFLDWQRMSTYGKKFGKLPFNMLFTAAFNWGLDRYIGKDKKIKDEYKELKAKAKEMSKLQKESEDLNESTAKNVLKDAINALTKTFAGKKLDKAYVKDYLESMERMAKKSPREFVKDYMNFSNDDWIEDVEYNMANEKVNERRRSREPFTFTAKEVQDAADLVAKAISKLDKVKAEVHDMEYAEGEGASFEISMDGEKYDGGSYDVRPTGEVVNVAIGNSFPNAIYAKIGDKNINQIMKNIKKFESVEVNEAAPRMKTSKETEELERIKKLVVNARKGGMGNRYGKEFDKAKNKAVVALDNMISYSKIGS